MDMRNLNIIANRLFDTVPNAHQGLTSGTFGGEDKVVVGSRVVGVEGGHLVCQYVDFIHPSDPREDLVPATYHGLIKECRLWLYGSLEELTNAIEVEHGVLTDSEAIKAERLDQLEAEAKKLRKELGL